MSVFERKKRFHSLPASKQLFGESSELYVTLSLPHEIQEEQKTKEMIASCDYINELLLGASTLLRSA